MQKIILVILIIFAVYLRVKDIDRPMWIDEAIYANYVEDPNEIREIVPYLITNLQQPENRQQLRIPFIIFSVLSVFAIWLVVEDKRKALVIAAIIAIAPIYVYWGTMARPYTVALFFVIMGWRWPVFYLFAIATTPIALGGLNIWKIKERWLWYLFLVIGGVFYYYSMELSNLNHFSLEYLLNAKRLWLFPIANLMLNCTEFNLERLQGILKYGKRLVGYRV